MALIAKVTGTTNVQQNVRALPKRLRRRAYRIALDAAGGEFKDEVKKRAPRETGLLKKSISVKTRVPDNDAQSWTKVGPGRGYKQAVELTKSRKRMKLVAKKTAAMLPAAVFSYRNPTRYAHLVEGGTKRGVRPRRFMALSMGLRQNAAIAKMESKLRSAVWNYNNN